MLRQGYTILINYWLTQQQKDRAKSLSNAHRELVREEGVWKWGQLVSSAKEEAETQRWTQLQVWSEWVSPNFLTQGHERRSRINDYRLIESTDIIYIRALQSLRVRPKVY